MTATKVDDALQPSTGGAHRVGQAVPGSDLKSQHVSHDLGIGL